MTNRTPCLCLKRISDFQRPLFKSGNTYWCWRRIHRWSAWSGNAQGQLEGIIKIKVSKWITAPLHSHPSQVAAGGAGGEAQGGGGGLKWQNLIYYHRLNLVPTFSATAGVELWLLSWEGAWLLRGSLCEFGKVNIYTFPPTLRATLKTNCLSQVWSHRQSVSIRGWRFSCWTLWMIVVLGLLRDFGGVKVRPCGHKYVYIIWHSGLCMHVCS